MSEEQIQERYVVYTSGHNCFGHPIAIYHGTYDTFEQAQLAAFQLRDARAKIEPDWVWNNKKH